MTGPKIEKLSISVPRDVARGLRAAASSAGLSVSAWLSQAAAAELRLRNLRKFLDELDAEYGPVPDKVKQQVDARMDRARLDAAKRWKQMRRRA